MCTSTRSPSPGSCGGVRAIVLCCALRAYVAEVQPNPQGHQQIRRLLAEKYGWRDLWVGLLTDTSGSLGIVLTPPARSPTPPRAH